MIIPCLLFILSIKQMCTFPPFESSPFNMLITSASKLFALVFATLGLLIFVMSQKPVQTVPAS